MSNPPGTVTGAGAFDTRPRWMASIPEAPARPLPLVVALHGMGQDITSMREQVAPLLGPDRALLLPEGPLPFETRDEDQGRRIGHAWYVYTGDQDDFLDWARRAEDYLFSLIDMAVARFPVDPDRVALLGYSQGGYLAGIAALRHPARLRAAVVVNARVKHEVAGQPPAGPRDPEFLVLHGENDRFIPVETARAAAESLGARARFETFPSGHRFTAEQAQRAAAWLADRGL